MFKLPKDRIFPSKYGLFITHNNDVYIKLGLKPNKRNPTKIPNLKDVVCGYLIGRRDKIWLTESGDLYCTLLKYLKIEGKFRSGCLSEKDYDEFIFLCIDSSNKLVVLNFDGKPNTQYKTTKFNIELVSGNKKEEILDIFCTEKEIFLLTKSFYVYKTDFKEAMEEDEEYTFETEIGHEYNCTRKKDKVCFKYVEKLSKITQNISDISIGLNAIYSLNNKKEVCANSLSKHQPKSCVVKENVLSMGVYNDKLVVMDGKGIIRVAEECFKDNVIKFKWYEHYQPPSRNIHIAGDWCNLNTLIKKNVKGTIDEITILTALNNNKFSREQKLISMFAAISEIDIFPTNKKKIQWDEEKLNCTQMFNSIQLKNEDMQIFHIEGFDGDYVRTAVIRNRPVLYVGSLNEDFDTLKKIFLEYEDLIKKDNRVIVFLGNHFKFPKEREYAKYCSIELLLLELILYLKYPNNIVIIRGKYETLNSDIGTDFAKIWTYKFSNKKEMKTMENYLNVIFDKLPLTVLHKNGKNTYISSSGGPVCDSNNKVSIPMILAGGIIDDKGEFTHPNEATSNNCLWNWVSGTQGVDGQISFYDLGRFSHIGGSPLRISNKTAASYKSKGVTAYIFGGRKNEELHGFYYSLSTGKNPTKKDRKQKIIFVTKNGAINYFDI